MENREDNGGSWVGWGWPLALFLTVFLAFLPGASHAFLFAWDDSFYVSASELAPGWANAKYWLSHTTEGLFTPVSMWSLMLDRWLFGFNPVGYHLHNHLLHSLAAVLLYGIARHLRINPWMAFFLALLWAVHPQRVESVAWVAERRDVLAGVFGFGSVLLFMRSFDQGRLPWAATAALLLALDAKPSTVLIPAVMALYALWRRPKLDSLRHLVPILAAAGAHYIFFYMHCGSVQGTMERFPRLVLVPLHNALWYLLTAFVPFELNPLYPRIGHDVRTWLVLAAGGAALLAAGAYLWRLGGNRRAFLIRAAPFAAAWLCLFLPVSSPVRFNDTDYCDRYNYLLSAVAWLALGAFCDAWARRPTKRRVFAAVALGAAAIYLFMTWTYLPYWQDCRTLFTRAVEGVSHPNPRALVGMGAVGLREKDPLLLDTAGRLLLELSSQDATFVLPKELTRPDLAYNTGLFYVGMGRYYAGRPDEALKPLEILERRFHGDRSTDLYCVDTYASAFWGTLAACQLAQGGTQAALRSLQVQMTCLPPASADAHFCAGMIALLRNDRPAASAQWRKTLELSPGHAQALRNLQALEAGAR